MKRKKAEKVLRQAWTVKDIISNVLWFLLGGLWLGVIFGVAGLLLCLTVVWIPFGTQCFRIASVAMFPYGKKVELRVKKHLVANVIWAILPGWVLALIFFASGLACCITVVGFFRGLQAFKLAKAALCPFGAKISARSFP